MRSLTLLLVPLLFLSSCSIDWNDEKDAKIAELQKHITVLSWELSSLQVQLQVNKASEAQTVTGSVDSQKVLLGTGFSLSQTDQETSLLYSGAAIKTWSNTPPQKKPFVWDEWCERLSIELEKIPPSADTNNQRQQAWERLGINGQKDCMKENYLHTITTEAAPKQWFYIIKKLWYEWADRFLFDSTNMKVYDLPIDWEVKRIEVWASGIYVLAKGGRGNDGWVLFIETSNGTTKKLFWNNDENTPITVDDFELLPGWKISISYTEWSTMKGTTLTLK